MDAYIIPGIFGNKICKVKPMGNGLYQISRDNLFMGYIRKENGGWMLEEQAQEELNAENVQLIGDKIDHRRR